MPAAVAVWNHGLSLLAAGSGWSTAIGFHFPNPDGGPFALHTFGADLEGETRFDGFTIPYLVTAGWHHGTDRWVEGEFIRYTLDRACYR